MTDRQRSGEYMHPSSESQEACENNSQPAFKVTTGRDCARKTVYKIEACMERRCQLHLFLAEMVFYQVCYMRGNHGYDQG